MKVNEINFNPKQTTKKKKKKKKQLPYYNNILFKHIIRKS